MIGLCFDGDKPLKVVTAVRPKERFDVTEWHLDDDGVIGMWKGELLWIPLSNISLISGKPDKEWK